MKQPSPEELREAAEWIDCYEADYSLKPVVNWLRHRADQAELTKSIAVAAKAHGVSAKALRAKLRSCQPSEQA